MAARSQRRSSVSGGKRRANEPEQPRGCVDQRGCEQHTMIEKVDRRQVGTLFAPLDGVRCVKALLVTRWASPPLPPLPRLLPEYPPALDGCPGSAGKPLRPLPVQEVADDDPQHTETATPFDGSLFRISTGRGKSLPGGAKDYIHNARMTGGFAILAYPADYRLSGVMTSISSTTMEPSTTRTSGHREWPR
jgi:Protein of unknown function (DUF2950)